MWTFEMLLNEQRRPLPRGMDTVEWAVAMGPSDQIADFQDRTEPHTGAQRFGFQSWG